MTRSSRLRRDLARTLFATLFAGTALAQVDPSGPEAEVSEPEAGLYAVRSGDTLWSIAEALLGDGTLWPALYRANRDRIKDPRDVYPGQRLSIPKVTAREVREIRREAAGLLER